MKNAVSKAREVSDAEAYAFQYLPFLGSIQVFVEKPSVNATVDDDAAGRLELLIQLPDQLISIGI